MFDDVQTTLFNKGYGAYREIIQLVLDNASMISKGSEKNTAPALVMLCDIEIQRMLLHVSDISHHEPTEDEQQYIKSLIESADALKSMIPGYSKFYWHMTPGNYTLVEPHLKKMTQEIPAALAVAVELEKKKAGAEKTFIADFIVQV